MSELDFSRLPEPTCAFAGGDGAASLSYYPPPHSSNVGEAAPCSLLDFTFRFLSLHHGAIQSVSSLEKGLGGWLSRSVIFLIKEWKYSCLRFLPKGILKTSACTRIAQGLVKCRGCLGLTLILCRPGVKARYAYF